MHIPEDLTALLQPNEEILFIQQARRKPYRRQIYISLVLAIAWAIGINAYFFTYGSLFQNDFFASILAWIFINFPLFTLGIRIYRLQSRYPKSFYAYSNQRVIFTTMIEAIRIRSVALEDIERMESRQHRVIIFLKKEANSPKKQLNVEAVEDAAAFKNQVEGLI